MTDQNHTSARVVDASSWGSVRARLAGTNTRVVAVVHLDHSGANVAVCDMAREQVLSVAPPLGEVMPRELDRALADHLVAVGRLNRPTDADWRDELNRLAGQGRTRLASSAGAFIMGERQVRLFRLTQRDLRAATAPLLTLLTDYIDTAVTQADAPDAPVILTAAHILWPGLTDMLAEVRRAPVIVVDDAALGTPRTPIIESVSVVAPHAATSDPEPVGDRHDSVDAFADDMTAVTDRLPVTDAGGDHDHVDPDLSDPEVLADNYFADNYFADNYFADNYNANVDDDRGDDLEADPVASERTVERDRRWYSRPRWLLGGAVAGVLAVFGTAVAFTGSASEPARPAAISATTQAAPTSVSASATPQYANPADLVEARRPAVLYTPPPPPSSTENARPPRNSPRENRPRPRPRISIPVPGLPPIVIP